MVKAAELSPSSVRKPAATPSIKGLMARLAAAIPHRVPRLYLDDLSRHLLQDVGLSDGRQRAEKAGWHMDWPIR